jgi:5-methylcytosine-specific restriction endonuclease McrA
MKRRMNVKERRKQVAELWPDHTDSEIAALLEIEVWTVWNDVRKLGLKKGHRALPERWKRARRGPGNPNWKGGSRSKREKRITVRHLMAYKEFVETVLSRDGYRCRRCNSRKDLIVHHIKSEKEFPELLLEFANAETLCRACHLNEHRARGDISQ